MSGISLENMLLLPSRNLDISRLVFGGEVPAISPYYGLIMYGPYELPPKPPRSIILLYPNNNEFKDVATKIIGALKDGYKGYFPGGFTNIFQLDIDLERIDVDFTKYDMLNPKATTEAFYNRFLEVCKDVNSCFPVIMMNRVPRGLYESLYTGVKYRFTIEGIPSQVVTYEVFSDENRFKWSTFPLALQIFVKMGGTPFLLYDRLNIPEDEVAIIIGVGLSRVRLQDKESRYIGFALAFEANGRWRLIKWNQQPYRKEMLPQMLRTLIHNVVYDVLDKYVVKKPRKIHVIVHYSGKNVSVAEENALRDACQRIGQVLNIDVIPYLVKIQESMYRLYNEDSPCIDSDGQPTYLVRVGTVISLKEDLYLLQTTGCVLVQTSKGQIIFRPNAQGAPSPIIVSIKRLQEVRYELNDIELVKSVLYMARMNYASINNPVSRLPISVKYSKLLAYMTAKLAYKLNQVGGDNINSLIPDRLKQVLWFI
uniref:Piwi domain-containing protein n=1 Tax=Ignisphaera aggregans TaxID=334771 RepID=A0A7C4FFY4_9CREN